MHNIQCQSHATLSSVTNQDYSHYQSRGQGHVVSGLPSLSLGTCPSVGTAARLLRNLRKFYADGGCAFTFPHPRASVCNLMMKRTLDSCSWFFTIFTAKCFLLLMTLQMLIMMKVGRLPPFTNLSKIITVFQTTLVFCVNNSQNSNSAKEYQKSWIMPLIIAITLQNKVSCISNFSRHVFIFIFGCDSSPRSPNVSVCVCLCVTLATTVLKL